MLDGYEQLWAAMCGVKSFISKLGLSELKNDAEEDYLERFTFEFKKFKSQKGFG